MNFIFENSFKIKRDFIYFFKKEVFEKNIYLQKKLCTRIKLRFSNFRY